MSRLNCAVHGERCLLKESAVVCGWPDGTKNSLRMGCGVGRPLCAIYSGTYQAGLRHFVPCSKGQDGASRSMD